MIHSLSCGKITRHTDGLCRCMNSVALVMTICLYVAETIPTLWPTVNAFVKKHPTYVAEDNAEHFMVDDPTQGLDGKYNLCHVPPFPVYSLQQFWSNFEIADLRFFRSQVYSDYFEYLDKTGGFFYERWGDAPVHSIAATFFLPKSQIHFFHDIGYRHSPYIRCPQDEESHLSGRCSCERANNFGTCIFIIMSNCRL